VALACELFLKGECQFVVHLVQTVVDVDLSFVGQVDELGLKLVKALSLVYTHLLVLPLGFAYAMRVDEVFSEVVDHLGNCLEGVSGIGLVSSVQVTLSVSISNVEDVIHTSVLICEVVGVDLEFANDLDVPVVVSRTNAVAELCWIRDLSGAGLTILMAFLFD
jgi:hypothetical protein